MGMKVIAIIYNSLRKSVLSGIEVTIIVVKFISI